MPKCESSLLNHHTYPWYIFPHTREITLFYKNTLYKNIEPQNGQKNSNKLRTNGSLDYVQ